MNRADGSHAHRRRRTLLAAIAAVFGVALTFGLLELGASLYLWAETGRLVLPATRLLDERNAYVEAVATEACSYGDSILVHPYLAHVQTGRGRCGAAYANSKSLIGKEYPDVPPVGTGVILVTGGSVAAQFTWDNREKPSPLEEILEEQFAGGAYEHFVVLERLRHGLRKYASRTGRAGRPDEDWVRASYQDMFAMHTPMERDQRERWQTDQGGSDREGMGMAPAQGEGS